MDFRRCKTIVVALTKGLTMAKTEQAREMDNKSKKNYVARSPEESFENPKNNFKECFDMFHGANGFVWGPENKMWAAKPRTWKAFVKAKPKSKMDDYSNWPS
ncbi:hypothetical protein OIU77_020326 [Salix suchowensis]|uniref:Uncharacterized protein n=1 Tax=Salix suchowensis TaxID=1278906 RepID=A0ABQ9CN15_9ROSI|nr:hypothetical protein OIU77_020326 [Salix suchowensis]